MTDFIPIATGQWVLVFPIEYFDEERSLAENVERLQYRGAGWDSDEDIERVISVLAVSHVMAKTFRAVGQSKRFYRAAVIAATSSHAEAEALRLHLLAIGKEAAVSAEAEPIAKEFARSVRVDAFAKIHAALPHIFANPGDIEPSQEQKLIDWLEAQDRDER